MDPDTAWVAMLQAVSDDEWESALEYAEALLGWLRMDGFPPIVTVGLQSAGLLFDFDQEGMRRSTADSVARSIALTAKRKLGGE
jgi:hypothetical protein